MICEPTLLLCDEPTGNLDRKVAESVADILVDLEARQQVILVVVTHNPELAGRLPVRFDLVDHRLERRT